ncbi:MAG: hypothetical protein NZ908_02325 [Candidatus Micrarchaeota archaeon]|nr:hypothetical protein [Candidatus Micrarchaeota archaeon]
MIVGDIVEQVVVSVKSRENVPIPSFNFKIVDVLDEGEVLSIKYESHFDYKDAGKIVITGTIYDRIGDKDKYKKQDLINSWKDSKRLPNEYAMNLMSVANWICTIHATVICQTIRFRPPVIPVSFRNVEGEKG